VLPKDSLRATAARLVSKSENRLPKFTRRVKFAEPARRLVRLDESGYRGNKS
jgi:hypothetical protein